MRSIDFGRHSDDYAAYRPGLPTSFYERLGSFVTLRGSRSLDLASGPGTIALELAARGSSVVGVDTAPEQIATARRVATERGLDHAATFEVASAEETGLEPASFDVVTAGSCWHWFDPQGAVAEIERVLRPGGILAIVHYAYLATHSPVAKESEDLILRFNPSWPMAGSNGTFPNEIDDVIRGGLLFLEAFCHDHDEEFSHAAWRGRMRTSNGVGSGDLPPAEVDSFDHALGELLRKNYPDPMTIPHRVWCVVARKPS